VIVAIAQQPAAGMAFDLLHDLDSMPQTVFPKATLEVVSPGQIDGGDGRRRTHGTIERRASGRSKGARLNKTPRGGPTGFPRSASRAETATHRRRRGKRWIRGEGAAASNASPPPAPAGSVPALRSWNGLPDAARRRVPFARPRVRARPSTFPEREPSTG